MARRSSTKTAPESEPSADDKLLYVWVCFDEFYGSRWGQKMGNDPLGRYKNAEGQQNPRKVFWLETVKGMSLQQIKDTLDRIRRAPKPDEWWLPDLQDFVQFSTKKITSTMAPNMGALMQKAETRTWVTRACDKFSLAAIQAHPSQIGETSLKQIWATSKQVAVEQNQRLALGELPTDPTAETMEQLKQILLTKFKSIKITEPTQAEMDAAKARAGLR